MGAAVSVELWVDDATVAKEAIEAVMQEMVHVDQTMSPFIETSELSLLNREAVAHPVKFPRNAVAAENGAVIVIDDQDQLCYSKNLAAAH